MSFQSITYTYIDTKKKVQRYNMHNPRIGKTGDIKLTYIVSVIVLKQSSQISTLSALLYTSKMVNFIQIRSVIVQSVWAKILAFEIDLSEVYQFLEKVIWNDFFMYKTYNIWYNSWLMHTFIQNIYWNISYLQRTWMIYIHKLKLFFLRVIFMY